VRTEPRDVDRPTPRTFNRAATAVVQCRSHLDKARDQMSDAIDILSRLEDPDVPWLGDPSERAERILSLQALLAQLEQVRRELLDAAAPDGSVVGRGDGHGPGGP